jgi:hypothetical protein
MGRAKVKKRRKPGPPRTTGPGKLIGVRILPALLKRIDTFAATQGEILTRQDAMRRLIERGLDAP